MLKSIQMYPVLKEHHLKEIGFNAVFSATYVDELMNRIKLTMKYDEGSNSYKMLDEQSGKWNHEKYDADIAIRVQLKDVYKLFGEDGIAPIDSSIGVALMWSSQESSQRGIEKLFTFEMGDSLDEIAVWKIARSTLRRKVDVSLILYIADVHNLFEGESHLAHQEGLIIGTPLSVAFVFEDNGSLFPIIETHQPGDPLWWVECSWEDPFVDLFNVDMFAIYLNSAHVNYSDLEIIKGLQGTSVYREIISGGLELFIQKLIENNELEEIQNKSMSDLENGTIARVAKHFIDNMEFDVSSCDALGKSIRKKMDTLLGGNK